MLLKVLVLNLGIISLALLEMPQQPVFFQQNLLDAMAMVALFLLIQKRIMKSSIQLDCMEKAPKNMTMLELE